MSEISDHLYKVIIIGGSGIRKADALLNRTYHQPDLDNIYLYTKDPNEAKYQLLINKPESVGFKAL